MDLGALLQAFVTVFPAELPDKSMFATIALVTHYHRPVAVWLGVSSAFVVHVAIAVLAGGLLGLLPDLVVGIITAALFGIGAILLFRSARQASDDEEVDLEGRSEVSALRVALISFGVVAVAEWGDLTQLATAGLASRSTSPVSIGVGAWLAMISVAALGVTLGRRLTSRVSFEKVNYLAAAVFAALCIWTAIDLI
ncbi:MAG: UPF0016 domain-containing protein [Acidimicrobiia bacterium]|nr:UPF0016 domain-containing protein [Acidimicrobiia bacterium]